jgi:hypothetical protein
MKSLARYLTHTLRKNVPILAIAVVLGMAMCCSSAIAQSGAGLIQGTVADATGAVIQQASIHVVNLATNVAADTKSNAVGFYQVPSLFTGMYTVTITAPHMKTYKTSIELLVNQHAVINASLTAGSVTQQVEVLANIVQLTTNDSGTIASTLENQRINQLPMNGRNPLNLAGETTPGLESCSNNATGTCPNGLFGQALEYVADGATLTNREYGGEHVGLGQLPDPDAIQEIRIETSGVGAEFATPAAGIITTKSGSNSLHGSLFETSRNSFWGIAKSRSNPAIYSAPHLVRNEFGASAGGPIILPHLYNGKEKSFWFFAYERYSNATSSYATTTTPTTAMRNGDFSGLINGSGVLQQLYDPNTTVANSACPVPTGGTANNSYCRKPFSANQIPLSRLSPASKILFDITPPPTNNNNPLVASNLSAVSPSYTIIPTITFRLDHDFNENNRAYLHYTSNVITAISLRAAPATIAADGFPNWASGITFNPDAAFTGALGFTHTFSPTFFSETVVSQSWWGEQNFAGGTPTANFESQFGTPNNFGEPGFPYFENILSPLQGTQFIYGVSQVIDNIDENLTKTVGRHQMQFGGRYRHERLGVRPDEAQDTIHFGAYATALENPASGTNYSGTTNTGFTDADMFLGAAYSYSVNEEPVYAHTHDMEFDGYFEDNYHVSRNVTVNLGLRYEAHPGWWTKNGLMQSFDLANDAIVLASTPAQLIAGGYTTQAIINNIANDGGKIETAQQAGMPANTLLRNNNFNVEPRLGFAYQPFNGKYGTVVRGAYGRYLYPVPIRSSIVNTERNAPMMASYTQSFISASQSPTNQPNYLMLAPQGNGSWSPTSTFTPIMGINSSNVVNTTTSNALLPGIGIFSMDPDYKPSTATQADFTIEQPLKGGSALRLSWLWSHGTNLDQEYKINQSPTSYVWEMEKGIVPPTGGTSAIGTNQYSATALGPYDNVTWGGMTHEQSTGWSNDNALQATYQRLFHHGIAYQINYTWSRPFRAGGNDDHDSYVYPTADYVGNTQGTANTYMTPAYGPVIAPNLPAPTPANLPAWTFTHEMNRFQNYMIDTGTPKQHILFNGVVDLPFGKGKRFLGNSNRWLDELVGGFQLAGDGNIVSQDFAVSATNWGPTHPIQTYKHGANVTDCRSGTCLKSKVWFNGYIAPPYLPSSTNGSNASCTPAAGLITGLPSSWIPSQQPIDTDCNKSDAAYAYYGSNEVQITLPGGTAKPIVYAPAPTTSTSGGMVGANPYAHTVLNGPINYTVDLSLFKVFPITERTNLRFNFDAFNALNDQGYNNPSSLDGTSCYSSGGVGCSSANSPRVIQLTLRLSF